MAKFNAEKYIIPLKGKDYLPVAARVAWFREEHPQGCIATDLHSVGNTLFARAEIHVDDVLIATGMASVRSGQNQVWNGREIEKAETAAIGRALAAAGYGTLQAGEDLDEGDYLADSPVGATPPPQQTQKTWATPENVAKLPELVGKQISDPTITKVEVARLAGIERFEDYAAWSARFASGKEAVTFMVAEFNAPAKQPLGGG